MKLQGLANMLGEFVAIQKSPDFKLTAERENTQNEAVKKEKREYEDRLKEIEEQKADKSHEHHRRIFFSVREYSTEEREDIAKALRRQSAPVVGTPEVHRRHHDGILKRIKEKIHWRHSITPVCEDSFAPTGIYQRRDSS